MTLQLTRDPSYSRGFLSARSVTGFLSDIYSPAADEIGKIHLIADERVKIFCMLYLFHVFNFKFSLAFNFVL